MTPSPTHPPTLVVLAAGIGSRYGGLKQIEPVGPSGEIVIDYSIYDAIRAGFGRVVFVIRREIEELFKEVVEPHFAGRLPHSYVYQELTDVPESFAAPAQRAKPWGTGHAVYASRNAVAEPFGVINADDFYGPESFRLLAERLRALPADGRRYCLVGFVLRNTLSDHGPVARGVCAVRDGLLENVTERYQIQAQGGIVRHRDGELTGDEIASMNLWGFLPSVFGHLDREFREFLGTGTQDPKAEFQLPTAIDSTIRRQQVSVEVLTSPERWLGVTYPEDRPIVAAGVRELIARGVYPEKLWS